MTQQETIEIQLDADTRQLADSAAAASGCASLTEFISRLIRESAPAILQQQAAIQLSNSQFDHFLAICNDTTRQPSTRILDAARRLDTKGD